MKEKENILKQDNLNENNKYINILNESFEIPKEKNLYWDIKDTKLNLTYSLSNIPTCTTSNSNLNSSSRKRPHNMIKKNYKKIKRKYKKVTFNDDNLVEYVNVDNKKKYDYIEKKNNNIFKGLNKKENKINCGCLIS